jgi:hypothetical protein
VIEFTEDRSWHLVFDASTTIDVDYDEGGDRLMLTANVAALAADAREKSFGALLRYNYLWTSMAASVLRSTGRRAMWS